MRVYWTRPGAPWQYRIVHSRDGWTIRELDIGHFPSFSQALCYVRERVAPRLRWEEHQEPE